LRVTYLRGTIDSFTVLGKSSIVGKRPGILGKFDVVQVSMMCLMFLAGGQVF
jgi:hypothetical protein